MPKLVTCSTEFDSMMFLYPWIIIEHSSKTVEEMKAEIGQVNLHFEEVMGEDWGDPETFEDGDILLYVEKVKSLLPEYSIEATSLVDHGIG